MIPSIFYYNFIFPFPDFDRPDFPEWYEPDDLDEDFN